MAPEEAALPGTEQNDLATKLRAAVEIMNVMREAGSAVAEATEGDDCAKSNASLRAAIRAAQEAAPTIPGARAPRWLIAPEARYLELCRQLPPDAQRCTRHDHRAQYPHECRATFAALTPEHAQMHREMSQPLPAVNPSAMVSAP